jgi:hypothetical protein
VETDEFEISTEEEEPIKQRTGDDYYMFPTPDEINKARPPTVVMVFAQLTMLLDMSTSMDNCAGSLLSKQEITRT